MVLVSGPLSVMLTTEKANISGVLVAASQNRPHGTGLLLDQPSPASLGSNNVVSFSALPGPCVITLLSGGRPLRHVKGIVPDKESATLAEVVSAGNDWTPHELNMFQKLADQAQQAALVTDADRQQTSSDRAVVESARDHIDGQVESIDTAFTESIPPYLQPDAPHGLDATYAPKLSIGQIDYVDQIERMIGSRTLTVTKVNGGNQLSILSQSGPGDSTEISLTPSSGGTVPRYQYAGTVSTSSLAGEPSTGIISQAKFSELTTTGAFLGQTTTVFTTEVGATMEWTVEAQAGDVVRFGHLRDNRGGVWQFEIVEHPGVTFDLSTWAASSGARIADVLTIPAGGTKTIRATFMGDDPNNPPSSGPGTSRGWGHITTSPSTPYQFGLYGTRTGLVISTPLVTMSNKDFALSLADAAGGAPLFVPYHQQGVETEERIDPPRFLIDGVEIDVAGAATGTSWSGKKLVVIQHLYGLNPNSPNSDKRIIEVWSRQEFTTSGRMTFQVRWKALRDLTTTLSVFGVMLPVDGALFDQVVSSTGVARPHTLGSTTQFDDFIPAGDLAQSWLAISSAHPDIFAAMTVHGMRDSLRVGQDRKPGDTTWVSHRSSGGLKVYPSLFAAGQTIRAGENFHTSGDILYGRSPGVHGLFSRL